MKIVPIQSKNSQSLYLDLSAKIEEQIINGDIRDGEKLPPVRKLAEQLEVSNATIISAYRYLENKGLVYTKRGSGTYTLPQNRKVLEDEACQESMPIYDNLYIPDDVINLAGSTPGLETFPVHQFKAALNHVLDRDGGNAFAYHESEGYEGLRSELVSFAQQSYNINGIDMHDILITSGAQQAIDLISKVLLKPDDTVLVENPSYIGAGSIFALRGAKILGVPMEHDGLNIDVLKHYVKRYHPRFLYTMPVYQSPTGISLSDEKRLELLDLAEKNDFYIIEEDMISELNLDDRRILPLKAFDNNQRVIYIKSFSKIFMPGLRTGFIIAQGRIAQDIINAKYITDISSSGLIQRSLCEFLQRGAWKEHLNDIRKIYTCRLNQAFSAILNWDIADLCINKPSGGFGFWIKLPQRIKDNELHNLCLSNGVLIAKGSTFYVSPMHGYDGYVRISYATAGEAELEKGLSVLEKCLKSILKRLTNKTTFYL